MSLRILVNNPGLSKLSCSTLSKEVGDRVPKESNKFEVENSSLSFGSAVIKIELSTSPFQTSLSRSVQFSEACDTTLL